MLAVKKVTDFASLFSPYGSEKKWQYDSELFQRCIKLTKQTCQSRQNFD